MREVKSSLLCAADDSVCNYFGNTFFGTLGVVLSIFITLCGFCAVYTSQEKKKLIEINLVGFAAHYVIGLAWAFYGFRVNDGKIVAPAVPAVGLSIGYIIILVPLASQIMREVVYSTVMVWGTVVLGIGAIAFTIYGEDENYSVSRDILGYTATLTMGFFWSTPLAAFFHAVISSNLRFTGMLFTFLVMLNGLSWMIYGLHLHDYFLIVPHGVIFSLSFLLLLCATCIICCGPDDILEEHERISPTTSFHRMFDVKLMSRDLEGAETADAATADAATVDTEIEDAATADTETADAATADAEIEDAATADTETADAETADAVTPDAAAAAVLENY